MKSFQQYITEVFDKPYKWRGGDVTKGSISPTNNGVIEDYVFKTSDGGLIELTASHFWVEAGEKLSFMVVKKEGHAVGIEFVKRKYKGTTKDRSTYGMTGEGDAMRIMATVLDIIKSIIKKHEPMTIIFTGDKTQDTADHRGREKTGRAKAYGAMVKRFAGKMGYKSDAQDSSSKVEWQLTKK